jgi:hypothetical protein
MLMLVKSFLEYRKILPRKQIILPQRTQKKQISNLKLTTDNLKPYETAKNTK